MKEEIEAAIPALLTGKVLPGLASGAAKAVGKRIAVGMRKWIRRDADADVRLAHLLDTWKFTSRLSEQELVDQLPKGVAASDVMAALQTGEGQALVHELMAARLSGVPEVRVRRLADGFGLLLASQLDGKCTPRAAAHLGQLIFADLDAMTSDLIDRIQVKSPDSLERVRNQAQIAMIEAAVDSIERHVVSLEQSRSARAQRAAAQWEEAYRTAVRTSHGNLEPPDFERKRKIPVDDLYVSPNFSSRTPEGAVLEPFQIDGFEGVIDRTVLLGDPGGGKSTATSVLAYRQVLGSSDSIPFVIVLRDFAGAQTDVSVVNFIEDRLATHYQCAPPKDLVETLLLSGRAIVFFDGLDELLDTTRRREVTERVELFAARYPMSRILVTSRKVGYEQAQMDPSIFSVYDLSGFSAENVRSYVERWFRRVECKSESEAGSLTRAFLEESRTVPDLRRNPLMLSLLCIIYRGEGFLPKNRPQVYERCARLLFEKWDEHRKIHVELRAGAFIDDSLKHLAHYMLTRDSLSEGLPETELVLETTDYLAKNYESRLEAEAAAKEFVEFCRGRAWVFTDAGSTGDGEQLYKFAHRTFMEYFAAFHLTRITDTPEELARLLLPRVAQQEWDMVGQLAVQIENKNVSQGAERVLAYLLSDRRRRTTVNRDHVLGFIGRCCSFIPVTPAFMRDVVDASVDSAIKLYSGRRDSGGAPSISTLGVVGSDLLPTVADQLNRRIDAMLDSGSSELEVFGTSLYAHVNNFFNGGGHQPIEMTDHAIDFWEQWTTQQLAQRKSQLIKIGTRHPAYLVTGWRYGVLSVEEYVEAYEVTSAPSLPLDGLFSENHEPIHQFVYFSLAGIAVLDTLGARGKKVIKPRQRQTQAAEVIKWAQDSLVGAVAPLVSEYGRDTMGRIVADDVNRSIEDAEPDLRAGLVLVMICIYEMSNHAAQQRLAEREALSLLRSLFERRDSLRSMDGAPLDEALEGVLDLDQRELVRRWADGEVDLVVKRRRRRPTRRTAARERGAASSKGD